MTDKIRSSLSTPQQQQKHMRTITHEKHPREVLPGFRGLFLRLLRPKMSDLKGAFVKYCDKSCNIFCMFVADGKLQKTMKVAKKVAICFV